VAIALLEVVAGIDWLTGDRAEAIAILIVLVINAAGGFATEWQAGRARFDFHQARKRKCPGFAVHQVDEITKKSPR
jgi:hypothetical protein